MADLASDEDRWTIFNLFGQLGLSDMEQIRADTRAILKLDYLPDLRQLGAVDAAYLIAELRRTIAARRAGND